MSCILDMVATYPPDGKVSCSSTAERSLSGSQASWLIALGFEHKYVLSNSATQARCSQLMQLAAFISF